MTGLPVTLTERFDAALTMAREVHAGVARKGTTIPYLAHVIGVASLVLDLGGDEDLAIAGLLHDAVEDGGPSAEADIRAAFGDRVVQVVLDCSDATAEAKAVAEATGDKYGDWLRRKLAYLAHLETASADALHVSSCDKLHNARAIVMDLQVHGERLFERFTAGRDGTLRYYASISATMAARNAPAATTLARVVAEMHSIAGAEPQHLSA